MLSECSSISKQMPSMILLWEFVHIHPRSCMGRTLLLAVMLATSHANLQSAVGKLKMTSQGCHPKLADAKQ